MARKTVADCLADASKTFTERGKIYGEEGYLTHGKVMKALFPDGITLRSEEDHNRFVLFTLCLAKLERYSKQFKVGGHQDSVHDLGVYAFMLESYDFNCMERFMDDEPEEAPDAAHHS